MKLTDKITCVDSVGSTSLVKGRTYEVIGVNGDGNIRVRDLETLQASANWYKPHRFTKAKQIQKLDSTKKYKTRSGLEVDILTFKGKYPDFPIVGYVQRERGWFLQTWTEEGRFFGSSTDDDDLDLIEIPEVPKVIVTKDIGGKEIANVYNDLSVYVVAKGLSQNQFERIIADFETMKKAIAANQ